MTELLRTEGLYKCHQNNDILSDINISIQKGEFISIVGPSGCGKTTLLQLLSGFDTANAGEIYFNNKAISHLPPQQRNIHTVFQHYALFPHLTVFENIAFPLRAKGINKHLIKEQVLLTLKQVKLFGMNDKLPSQLSGGQQQRVAIARAVINKPEMILLDESLSALDHSLRKQMQIELKQLQRHLGITFIYVTHSQEEALSMSERVIVLGNGRVQQIGTPREIYEKPANLFVASFIGDSNVFNIKVNSVSNDRINITLEGKSFDLKNTKNLQKNDEIHFILRAEDCQIWSEIDALNKKNMLEATVTEVIYKGSTVDLLVKLNSGKVISSTEFFNEDDENLNYMIGEKVWLDWIHGWEVILPHEQ